MKKNLNTIQQLQRPKYFWNRFVFIITFMVATINANAQNLLINGSFEQPNISPSIPNANVQVQVPASGYPGWTTSDPNNTFDIFRNAFSTINPYDGSQYLELNGTACDTISQVFSTSCISQLTWSFVHRGRYSSVDVVELRMGPVGGPMTTIATASDNDAQWGSYSGTYNVPLGQINTRIQFVCITSVFPSAGNFLDSVYVTGVTNCCDPWLIGGNYSSDCENSIINSTNNILGIKEPNPNALRVFTNNTEKMRVTSGGNVGIGTTNPTNLLHIGGASGPNPIRVETLNNAADSSFVTTDNNGVFHKRSISSLASAFCEWTRDAAHNTIYPDNVTDKVALGTNSVHTTFLNPSLGMDARLMLNGGDIIIQENPLNNPGAPDQGADVYLLDVNGKGLAITGQNGAAEVSTLGTNTSLHFNSDGAYHAMIIHGDPGNKGKVQIGNVSVNSPCLNDGRLFVEGGIQAEELLIINYHNLLCFPDFVFEAEHKLKSLAELSKYIKENKHLPGIPSSKEIETDGLNVAEMQAKQMEKIEELTLYMIEMKQEIEGLKKENEILKSSSINTKK